VDLDCKKSRRDLWSQKINPQERERDKGVIITQRGKLIEESKCLLTASDHEKTILLQ
jgi:hypothetical protein